MSTCRRVDVSTRRCVVASTCRRIWGSLTLWRGDALFRGTIRLTEILNRLIRKVLSSKTEFRRFRTVSNGFGRFRTVSDCFRTVSDGFGPFLDRFGSVSGVLRPFRTTLFLILKISNFNWPRLGPVRAVPSVRAVPPSRGQLKFEILRKMGKYETKTAEKRTNENEKIGKVLDW